MTNGKDFSTPFPKSGGHLITDPEVGVQCPS
jgi:hypothetical protein